MLGVAVLKQALVHLYAFYVCVFHLLLEVSGVPKTHTQCRQQVLLASHPCALRACFQALQPPLCHWAAHRLPEPTLMCAQGRLQVPWDQPCLALPCGSPYPVTDRCGSIDTSVPSPMAAIISRHGFPSFPRASSRGEIQSLAVVAGLTTYPFWLTLLTQTESAVLPTPGALQPPNTLCTLEP